VEARRDELNSPGRTIDIESIPIAIRPSVIGLDVVISSPPLAIGLPFLVSGSPTDH
jgi:hypothetical protein